MLDIVREMLFYKLKPATKFVYKQLKSVADIPWISKQYILYFVITYLT